MPARGKRRKDQIQVGVSQDTYYFFFLVENIEMISLIGGKLYIQVYESY